ncbi:MAG TPA: hypothetical protein VH682_13920 [Gemmataceae bacterium]|jgi:hypothetical protein
MGRTLGTAWIAAAALGLAGCSTGPLQENPILLRPDLLIPQENPLYIPQGPDAYDKVFQKALDVVDDFFEIAYANRYDGRIETQPSVAPGLEQPWKPGSPDFYQRLLAFFQSIRHRCILEIQPADEGGYFIGVKVLKELEDLPSPVRATAGAASFRMNSTIERQFEVIEQPIYESNWIPIGRDYKLEQVILERLAHCNFNSLPQPKPVYGP